MKPRMHTDSHGSGNGEKLRSRATTEQVIGCAYRVMNTLGCGFLEKVYENALAIEMADVGLKVAQQVPLHVWYQDKVVGDYVADLIVNDQVLVELKAVKALDNIHRAQCLNYLKATRLSVCLLMNFGNPRFDFKRLVL